MQLRQLIEYNMRNIFLEKSYIKCGRESIPSLNIYIIHTATLEEAHRLLSLWLHIGRDEQLNNFVKPSINRTKKVYSY